MRRTLVLAALLTGGCILEDNPLFAGDGGDTDGGTGSDTTGGGPGTDTMTTAPSTTASTTGGTDDTGPGTTGDDGGNGVGCDDPDECHTLYIGPMDNTCPHMADGAMTDECDYVGLFALRLAAANVDYFDEPGLIVMYDNAGTPAYYWGSIDLPGRTTIRVADGVAARDVVIRHTGAAGMLRLVEDEVHLEGFTIACSEGCEWAFTTRADSEVEGTETAGHLIENLVVASTSPEVLGGNSTLAAIESLGPETTIRNCHFWGFFEGTIDLRFAENSTLTHNTFIWYQRLGDVALDASNVDGLEISNNVFASMTRTTPDLIRADDGTKDLLVAGNAVERFGGLVTGVPASDPDVTREGNSMQDLAAESPRAPLFLADAKISGYPMATIGGTSLDGVVLADADELLPGAYQQRSPKSLPRRTVIRVGDGGCGGMGCDVDVGFENELQYAAWSAWPGSSVELYPSGSPFSGPVVISWPTDLRGAGNDPEDVAVRTVIEDTFLSDVGVWRTAGIINVTMDIDTPTVVENLTLELDNGRIGIFHEGIGEATHGDLHEIRRVVVHDYNLAEGQLGAFAFALGEDVSVHDVLIQGGLRSCLHFGPRRYTYNPTPTVRAFVHNVTCRLTVPPPDGVLSAFGVAAVDGAVIANAAVELVTPGPIFIAQRRTSGDADPDNAADKPIAFHAEALAVRGYSAEMDGYVPADGDYQLVSIDEVLPADPFFVGANNSHLDPLCIGIDTGVDPETLESRLSLGISLDGVDRGGTVPDRGCYEQGS